MTASPTSIRLWTSDVTQQQLLRACKLFHYSIFLNNNHAVDVNIQDESAGSSTRTRGHGHGRVPPPFVEEGATSGGGSCAELPGGGQLGPGGGGGGLPGSISQLLDAKRAQLQSLLDAPRIRP